MLLYITTDESREREPRPLHRIPETLNRLYDLGMREHDRAGVVTFAEGEDFAFDPDWRFDRDVIRLALFCQEHLKVAARERVALLGPLRRLWLKAEFGLLGLGVTVVGLDPGLADDDVIAALSEGAVRLAIATDSASVSRLLGLRFRVPTLKTIVAAEAGASDEAVVPYAQVRELGGTLDTPERANRFRGVARGIGPQNPALWHFEAQSEGGMASTRLSQGEAMDRVRGQLLRWPAEAGDLALFDTSAVTLSARLAFHAWVGDGRTTSALAAPDDLLTVAKRLRPTGLVARPALLARLLEGRDEEPAGAWEWLAGVLPWLSGIAGRLRAERLRRTLAAHTGGRLRFVLPAEPWPAEAGQGLEFLTSVLSPESSLAGGARAENRRFL